MLAAVVIALAPASMPREGHAQDIVISEFLAVNDGVLRDADGDDPDWIELHSPGAAIDLDGWYLTDDPADPTRWRLPAVELAPGGYLVVFASGKDRAVPGDELHASFSLSQDGEYLALVMPDGRSVAHEYAPAYPRQYENVSYGLSETSELRYFETPTPAAANGTEGVAGFVSDTRFTVDRGFYDAPVEVEISTGTEGAEIRYTLDGSDPTATRGEVYRGPLRIEATTTLRAAAFRPGFGPTNIDTHTYIFVRDVLEQRVLLQDIVRDEVYGPELITALTSIPSVSVTTSRSVPSSTEVEASVELIHPDGSEGFQIDAGIKRVGGHSLASYPKNNMRLYFRERYGRARLQYPLFEGFRYGEGAADTFDQLTLRSGSHDSVFYLGDNQQPPANAQYLRNRWMSDMEFEMGRLSLHGRFVHLYLNGTYWGHYHLMERPTRSFLASYLGGEKSDYEAVNSGRAVGPSAPAFARIRSIRRDYAETKRWVDVTNLADYVLLNFYAGNAWDWNPNQNWMAAGPSSPDRGGYRFFSWDTDIVLRRTTDHNLGQPGPDNLFRDLLRHDDFRVLVADRIRRHFFDGGLFTPDRVEEIYSRRAEEIFTTIVAETARWRWGGRAWTRDRQWQAEWDRLRDDFFPRRTDIVIEQMRRAGLYPDIEPPVFNRPGGRIEPGFPLVLVAPFGRILFTVDGSDPRQEGGDVAPGALEAAAAESETLLSAGALARVLVPTDGALGLAWTDPDFDDSGWLEGPTGVGFKRGDGFEDLILTDIEALMYQVTSSVYVRVPFTAPDPGDLGGDVLTLRMKYDDGFVAYLNGEPVATRNAPEDPRWDSEAAGGRPNRDAVVFERIDLSSHRGLLRAGDNLLAIHGLNNRANSNDLLVLPELVIARPVGGGVILERTTLVRSRVLAEGEWSPLAEAVFVADSSLLRVSEIMYHPPAPPPGSPHDRNDFEFVELVNAGDRALNLSGVRLSGGVEFTFPERHAPEHDLAPGETVLIVRDLEAFESRYGVEGLRVAGEYGGRLSNGGESLLLADRLGAVILDFTYDDGWHPSTDGGGHSLEIVDARGAPESWTRPASWRASPEVFGSPGRQVAGAPAGRLQRAGDLTQDGRVDISDVVGLLAALFGGAPAVLPCGESLDAEGNVILLDVNADEGVNLADAVYVLEYLFGGGAPPVPGDRCVRIAGCREVCAF